MCSYRRHGDKGNEDMEDQLQSKYPEGEKVDIPCGFDDGQDMSVTYDAEGRHHFRNKQQYEKMSRIRTYPGHPARLPCQENYDVKCGLANGTMLRAGPRNAWQSRRVMNRRGRQDRTGRFLVDTKYCKSSNVTNTSILKIVTYPYAFAAFARGCVLHKFGTWHDLSCGFVSISGND